MPNLLSHTRQVPNVLSYAAQVPTLLSHARQMPNLNGTAPVVILLVTYQVFDLHGSFVIWHSLICTALS